MEHPYLQKPRLSTGERIAFALTVPLVIIAVFSFQGILSFLMVVVIPIGFGTYWIYRIIREALVKRSPPQTGGGGVRISTSQHTKVRNSWTIVTEPRDSK